MKSEQSMCNVIGRTLCIAVKLFIVPLFRCFYGFYQHRKQFPTVGNDALCLIFSYIRSVAKKVEPVKSFVAFLQCYRQFIDKIRGTLCILSFTYQCTDGRTGTQYLVCQRIFLGRTLDIFHHIYNPYGEVIAFVVQRRTVPVIEIVVFHCPAFGFFTLHFYLFT